MNEIEIIEQYFAGELNEAEKKQFEHRLQTDEAFAEMVALYKMANDEMQQDDGEIELRKNLQQLNKQHFAKSAKAKVIPISNRKWWMTAAAVAACIALVVVLKPWQGKSLTNEEVYAQYAVPDELNVTVRGNNDSLLATAAVFFNKKEYTAALPLFDEVLKKDTANTQAKYHLAICYLQANKYTEALALFDAISSSTSIYKYDATAWKAFALLKQNKKEDCITLLQSIPEGAGNYAKVQKALKSLEK